MIDAISAYRYIMSMAVADYSGQAWLQAFNEAGAVIFGVPADEAVKIKVFPPFSAPNTTRH
jgi:hypothetical protein